MMKLKYSICCGLDVHKNVIVATIVTTWKKKSVRIAKAGDYLKPMMVQCAIAGMMMVCIYHMVSEKKPFTPTDYEELMAPQIHVERVVLNEDNVFAYLESLGYDSSKLIKRNDN